MWLRMRVNPLRVVMSPKGGSPLRTGEDGLRGGLPGLLLICSYPLGLAGVGAHARSKVLQLLANFSGEVPVLEAVRAERGGRWVPG